MSLSYEEALSTLQSMFADQGYTSAHLDAVLRHQGGHMENTVETLLLHGDGSPEELIRKLPTLTPGVPNANNAANNNNQGSIDQDAELARQLAAEEEHAVANKINRRSGPVAATTGGGGGVSLSSHIPTSTNIHAGVGSVDTSSTRQQQQQSSMSSNDNYHTTTAQTTTKKGRAVVLPNDFLRIPGRTYPTESNTETSSSSWPSRSAGGTTNMMMTDEQLARMLQDELFQEEIRNNPEFRHLAGRRNPRASAGGVIPQQAVGRSNYAGTGQVGGTGLEEVGKDMIEGLSKLGDAARRRFQVLASNWNDQSGTPGTGRPAWLGGGGGSGGTPSNRPNNESRRLLASDLNMDEEEESLNFDGGRSNSGGTDVEMNSYDKKKD